MSAMDAIREAQKAAGYDPDAIAERAAEVEAQGVLDELPPLDEHQYQPEPEVEAEQLALDPEEIVEIHYETLLDPHDVVVYKRVKGQTMQIAKYAREIIAGQVEGTVGDGTRSKKEFVTTRLGQYRVSMSNMSDNTTETAAHERMGVTVVHLHDPAEVIAFFAAHGLDGEDAYRRLYRLLKARFR